MNSDEETAYTDYESDGDESDTNYGLPPLDDVWFGLNTLDEYLGIMRQYIMGRIATSPMCYAPYDEDLEFTNLLLRLNNLGVLAVEWTRFEESNDRWVFPILEGKARARVNELVSAFLQVPDLEFVIQQGEHKILNVTLDHGEWLMRRHKPDGWTTGLDVKEEMFTLDDYFSVEADCVSFCVKHKGLVPGNHRLIKELVEVFERLSAKSLKLLIGLSLFIGFTN
jgi:hypothetical protein